MPKTLNKNSAPCKAGGYGDLNAVKKEENECREKNEGTMIGSKPQP